MYVVQIRPLNYPLITKPWFVACTSSEIQLPLVKEGYLHSVTEALQKPHYDAVVIKSLSFFHVSFIGI